MHPARPLTLIVGGGIGGLALAVAAKRFDLPVVVWERAPELREIGAGLLLTANALWVLDQLGIAEAARGAGRLAHTWQILNSRGTVLQTFASSHDQPFSISIARSAFQDVLRRAVPPENLFLDQEAVAIEPAENGDRMLVRSARGPSITADLVIGADGGKSVVREFLFGGELRECGYVGWRALVDEVPEKWRAGRISESWGDGCRFGIAPISETRSYWYATENVPRGWTVPVEKRKAHLLERFRRWHEPIGQLIEATPDERILLNSIAEHPRMPRWHRGCVGLLGDAAHLMTPNLGQGAAMALEDALVLARCLQQHGCGPDALRHYERRRKWRANWVVWQSRQVGRVIQLEHPWLMGLRDAFLRGTPDALGALALAPVFNFRA